MLKTINRAILEHRIVEIDYESVGKPVSKRRIEPYWLAFYQSSIYVIAKLEGSEELRNWKLDRFHHATALDEYFKADESIDPTEYLGKSIGIGDRLDTRLSSRAFLVVELYERKIMRTTVLHYCISTRNLTSAVSPALSATLLTVSAFARNCPLSPSTCSLKSVLTGAPATGV